MFAVLALCLLGFVAAQQPTPCTTPSQWEANFFEINEQNQFMVRGRLTYDAVYRRERIIEEVDVGRQDNFYDVIALFDAQTEYIFNLRTRNCTRRPINRPWRNFGVPQGAVSFGEAYIGSSAVPGAGLLSSLWGSNSTGPRANDTIRTFGTWTYQTCLPVRFIDRSTEFGRTEISFFDIVGGISDPSVFIPRPECLTEDERANRDTLFGLSPKKNHNK